MWLDFDVRDNRRWTSPLERWITDSCFSQKQQVEVKSVLMLLSSPDVNWWTVDYCDVFITLILTAPIHCRAHIADGMLHFSKSDEETNSSTFGWPGVQKFIFGWTTSFILWHYLWDLVNETALFSGMRRVMSTTPLISSISCTLLRGKVSSTVGWMSWDTCSRYRNHSQQLWSKTRDNSPFMICFNIFYFLQLHHYS